MFAFTKERILSLFSFMVLLILMYSAVAFAVKRIEFKPNIHYGLPSNPNQPGWCIGNNGPEDVRVQIPLPYNSGQLLPTSLFPLSIMIHHPLRYIDGEVRAGIVEFLRLNPGDSFTLPRGSVAQIIVSESEIEVWRGTNIQGEVAEENPDIIGSLEGQESEEKAFLEVVKKRGKKIRYQKDIIIALKMVIGDLIARKAELERDLKACLENLPAARRVSEAEITECIATYCKPVEQLGDLEMACVERFRQLCIRNHAALLRRHEEIIVQLEELRQGIAYAEESLRRAQDNLILLEGTPPAFPCPSIFQDSPGVRQEEARQPEATSTSMPAPLPAASQAQVVPPVENDVFNRGGGSPNTTATGPESSSSVAIQKKEDEKKTTPSLLDPSDLTGKLHLPDGEDKSGGGGGFGAGLATPFGASSHGSPSG